MGENKGHGDKAPSYPELDEQGSAANRAGDNAGNRQSAGNQQSAGKQSNIDQQDIGQQDIGQQGSGQQGSGRHDNRESGGRQQNVGNQQSAGGQQQHQQKGGQHASGGTPALDDLNAEQDSSLQGSLGNASQGVDGQGGWQGEKKDR